MSTVQSESIVGLFGELCNLHLGETKRCHLVQPSVDRDGHYQHLRRRAFDCLFSFLKSPDSKLSGVGAGGVRVEVDGVLQSVYQLRVHRRFEDADRLEHLLQLFLESSKEEDLRMLRFLVRLAGTETPAPSPPLGHDLYNPAIASEDTNKQPILPPGPLCYGDTRQTPASSITALALYMHFPSQLFEAHTPTDQVSLLVQDRPLSIFSLPPGTGIGGNGLFSAEREHRDLHERLTRLSLFGGLVQSRDTSLTVKLDLPDLPDDPEASPPEIKIPKAISMSELSEDEGFITTEASSSVTTPGESFVEEDIWDLALTTTPSQHYVWERIGCEPMVTERPYLTEAGPQTVDELGHLRRHHEHLLDPCTCQLAVRQVSTAQLVKDVVYLLVGIPSRTFPFSQAEDTFAIDHSVSSNGLSPEALSSFLSDFVTCGTHYHRLTQFSAPRELDSLYTQGLVLQAFTGAVRSVLQYYRAAVFSLPRDLTLLAMRMHCYKALRQIRFLAELCHCAERSASPAPGGSFPVGVQLISYLYQETLDSVNTDNYLLMLSLLRTTCQPFVLFIQDWVFHGTFRDVYGEFMIQMNPTFLEARDELYWEKGYTLTTADAASSVPMFLSDLAPDIFRCGKALNLLRMCCPQHFLCGVSDSEIPRLSISYARSDLHYIGVQCEMYVSRLRQLARQLTMSRAEKQRRAEEAQRALAETARRMAAAEIARLQGILTERRRQEDVKKRAEFQRLKEQMTADLQRRAGEVAEAKEEDKQHMARLMRQEEALTEQEIELEKQARDELIAYYTELGEEAAKREQRALWRIRRARLETARWQLLEEEEQKWRMEMEERKRALDLLQKSDDSSSLPDWVQRLEGSTKPLHVSGAPRWEKQTDTDGQERDWSLPKWVDRNVPAQASGDLPSGVAGPSVSANAQSVGEDGDVRADEPRATAVSAGVDVSSPAATGASKTKEEGLLLKPAEESRMPAWAQKVLNQSDEAGIKTIVVVDDDAADAAAASVDAVDGDGSDQRPLEQGSGESGEMATAVSGKVSHCEPPKSSMAGREANAAGQVPSTPRNARQKLGIRMVEGTCVSQQTEEQAPRPHIQVSDSFHATTESSAAGDHRPHIKQVSGMSATMETEGDESEKLHVRMSESMHATKETEEGAQKPHLKAVSDRGATVQCADEVRSIPKMARSSQFNIATETVQSEWKIKKPNLFGHVSELSKQDYTFQAPRLKRQRDRHANLESDFRDFAIKPRIHMHRTRSATAETEEQADRPTTRSIPGRSATMESEYVDVDGIRRQRFQEQNVFGHSSDSTVQRLLYGDKFGRRPGEEMEAIPELVELVPRFELSALDLMPDDLERFDDNFEHLNSQPMVDLVASMPGVVQGGPGGMLREVDLSEEEAHAIAFTPLSVLLQQALTAPLSAQISLVNETVVNYFLVDLKIDTHFEALHHYLFMADGDFAQNLTNILLEKLSSCQLPREMLTPVFLNSALNRALQLSVSASQQHADSLSFALRYMPDFFRHNAHDTLDCLELRYKVKWPINVILTEASQACYGQVFSFMLQLKRVAWTLTDCWYRLKRDAIVKKAKDSCQFRQLQLHRQEMQHFVRVMQGYMANQIIQVTWKELQEALDHDVHSVDDLKRVHGEYLHKALFRCLLNKKAAPIMKIIQDIFCLILKFCSQLSSAAWGQDSSTGEVTHPNFAAMVTSYKAFREYFVFLFKVVNKLAVRGYQPHLHELLLRLNFNDYYSTK